jgi:hypothetical protein
MQYENQMTAVFIIMTGEAVCEEVWNWQEQKLAFAGG